MRRSAIIIDLDAIKHNVTNIKKKIGKDKMICAVVKADAYGHGAVEVSRMLEKGNLVNYFGVASVVEGIELRKTDIQLPILILGLIMPDEAENALIHDLTLTVSDKDFINYLDIVAKTLEKKAKVHVKVDTGLGRIGCRPEEALEFVKYIQEKKSIYLEGIFSHFTESTSIDKSYSYKQLKIFNEILKELENNKIFVPIKHLANSGAILELPESYYDMVRPGLIIYGYYPSEETSKSIDLIPAMRLRSEIIFIKRVKKGTPISYGREYITQKDTNIATIPIGYADGIPRSLANNHFVFINGKSYPIVGIICMDQLMIDLGEDFYDVGTEVEIFGPKTVTVSDIANRINTIPHEIICRIKRVKRYYIYSEKQ